METVDAATRRAFLLARLGPGVYRAQWRKNRQNLPGGRTEWGTVSETRSWAGDSRPSDSRPSDSWTANSWAIDALGTQLRRLGEMLATLARLRGTLVSTAEGMLWRSNAADHFHRNAEVQVASIDGLVLALTELEDGVRRARVRAIRAELDGG